MPSTLTVLGVWNLALDVIKSTPLQSQNDDDATARWLQRNYAHIRDVALRSYDWNFAREYHSLSKDATNPPFRWSYAYTLPPDWLRVLPVTELGARNGKPVPHEVIKNKVYTNHYSPLNVRLIVRVDNTGDWDPIFTEMVKASLALGMANKFTGKNKFIELSSALLKSAQDKAEEIDTFEGSAEPVEQHDIIRVREG